MNKIAAVQDMCQEFLEKNAGAVKILNKIKKNALGLKRSGAPVNFETLDMAGGGREFLPRFRGEVPNQEMLNRNDYYRLYQATDGGLPGIMSRGAVVNQFERAINSYKK